MLSRDARTDAVAAAETPVPVGKPLMTGVASVGVVPKTAAPLPVSSLSAATSCAEVNDPSDVVLPTDVTTPVRLALVVTVPAVKPEAVPVMLVPTNVDGVPRFGVTNVGEVLNTRLVEVVPVVPVAALRKFNCAPVDVTDTAPSVNGVGIVTVPVKAGDASGA